MNGGTLEERLQELRDRNPDIMAAVLATPDGLPIASNSAPETDVDALAAVAADLMQRSSRAAGEVGVGSAQELFVRADNGYVMVVGCGPDTCLAVAASLEASLGMLLLDVHRGSQGLGDLV